MGPRSTAPFLEMVLDECQSRYGARFDMDFPKMVIWSLPTPFYPGKPVDHEAMNAAILMGLRELAATGVDFISIPCNTAHIYYEELKEAIGVPLLNIVDETLRSVPEHCSRPALLATKATMEAGIYQQGLAAAGKTAVLCDQWQGRVDRLLGSIKAGCNGASDETEMKALLNEAKEAGADCVIIACTDLTTAALRCGVGLPVVDSAWCLARATVSAYLERMKEQT